MKINLQDGSQISRNIELDKNLINEEERRVPFILISRDNGRKIFDFWNNEYIEEILEVTGANTESLNAVYYNHDLNSLPIARLENVRVDEGQLKGDVIFDMNDDFSEKIFKKVSGGFLRYCSIGYIPDHENIEIVKETNKITKAFLKKFRVVELSITGTPADSGAKIGRNQTLNNKNKDINFKKNNERSKEMAIENLENNNERERALNMLELGRMHGFERNSEEFIRNGKGVGEFKDFILSEISKRSATPNIQETNASFKTGMSENEKKKYSVRNAILAQIDPMKRNCFEREVSDSLEKETGIRARGILIPTDIPLMKRASTSINTLELAHGGSFVPTDFQGENFVDLLNNKMISSQLGIQQLTGLKGNVVIPRLDEGAKAYWVKENEEITSSREKTGALELKMKTVASYVDVTRSMLLNSDPSMDSLIINDISGAIARALDHAVFMGEGGDKAPTGIVNTKLVSVKEYSTAPSWDDVVDLESSVADKNADINAMFYVSSALMRGILKKTKKVENHPEYILQGDNLNGYLNKVTNQIDRDLLLFGDFSQILQGLWGALDILVDPYTKAQSGTTRLFAYQSADVGLRYPQSFAFLKAKKGSR